MFKIRRIAMHNPFARFFRARDKPNKQASPQDAVSAAPGFYYGTSLAGKSVTPTSAIQVSAVYALSLIHI